jgi:type I restriction enzyme S subunit
LVRALKRAKATAGQVNLTLEICRELPIPVPPVDEQAAILETVDEQLSSIKHLAGELTVKCGTSKALRQSIFRHAFSGELVQQDPKDEPASELLKRIAAARKAHTNAIRKTDSRKPASGRKKKQTQ